MGNAAASCAPSLVLSSKYGVVKVLLPDGNMEIYRKPVRAGDVMVENPGRFVCDSSGLKVGCRIEGLTADELLEPRQLYFLLPMELLYSVLTLDEFTSLSLTAKAMPAAAAAAAKAAFNSFGLCIFQFEAKSPQTPLLTKKSADQSRYSKQRSWKPALETIVETPCH